MRINNTRSRGCHSVLTLSTILLGSVLAFAGLGCQAGGNIGPAGGTSGNKGGNGGGNNGGGGNTVVVNLDAAAVIAAKTTTCGNNKEDPNEDCDDGNTQGGDGCTRTCQVEDGFECPEF